MENEKNYFTYGMIKPDGMPYLKEILEEIYDAGLFVAYSKIDTLDEKIIEENYPHCIGRDFYEGMKENLLRGNVLKMVIFDPRGNAVGNYRKKLGATKSWEAEPDTIRGKYGDMKIAYKNVAHGSGNVKEANDEIMRFFKKDLNDMLKGIYDYANIMLTANRVKDLFSDSSVNEILKAKDIHNITYDYSKKLEK